MRPNIRQVRGRPVPRRATQSGMVLPYALFVTVLILILGLAFLQTSATESLVATRNVQRLQANAAAEYGIARACAMAGSQLGDWFAMTYNGTVLTWATSPAYGGYSICTLFTNQTLPAFPSATYTVVIQDLSGDVMFSHNYRIHSYGTVGGYTRHVSLDCEAQTFAAFGWLTNDEHGVYFITGDTLTGEIYTNGQFNIDGNPAFKGPTFCGSPSLHYMNGGPPNYNPTFQAPGCQFNAPNINISELLNGGQITAIQDQAVAGGVSEPLNNGFGYTLTFNPGGTFTLVQNGGTVGRHTIQPVTLYNNAAISTTNGAFYFQDNVQVSGTLDGQVTVATSTAGNIEITNNLVYSYPGNPATLFQPGYNPTNDPLLTSKLALISGNDVLIAPSAWSNIGANMYVTAIIASVGGSFENLDYQDTPQKKLNIFGGICQTTRGAVGQTSGTGFVKDYLYDTRFLTTPPPFLPPIHASYSNWQLF